VGASISGTVRDSSRAGIPGASVIVRNLETGMQRVLVSDGVGRYAAPSVAVGRYDVTARKEGFESQVKTGVDLAVGQRLVLDFNLPVGQVQESVTVVELASPVAVTTQPSSGLVNDRQVKDLPLNGRSYDELMALNAATVNYTPEKSGGVATSNSAVGNMFAVSGRRPQENIFLLHGIEYTGASEINVTPGGVSGQLLGVDAVREFNVVTDTYGAEYGKRPGAQVSVVTSSGTNTLHGALYEFLRNSALDARNFFDQGAIPQFQRNQFGGALGGPIRKNRLFLFGDYEGFRQHLGLSDVTFVPDNAARAGYVPDSSGHLVHVGVSPGAQPLLALWSVANGPELGGGIAVAYSHPLQTIREDFGTTRLNVLNHTNFGTPNPIVFSSASSSPSPTADVITSTSTTSRQVQFGLKLLF
jgi:hypothetical protein